MGRVAMTGREDLPGACAPSTSGLGGGQGGGREAHRRWPQTQEEDLESGALLLLGLQ